MKSFWFLAWFQREFLEKPVGWLGEASNGFWTSKFKFWTSKPFERGWTLKRKRKIVEKHSIRLTIFCLTNTVFSTLKPLKAHSLHLHLQNKHKFNGKSWVCIAKIQIFNLLLPPNTTLHLGCFFFSSWPEYQDYGVPPPSYGQEDSGQGGYGNSGRKTQFHN
jgi:hypothetical protein